MNDAKQTTLPSGHKITVYENGEVWVYDKQPPHDFLFDIPQQMIVELAAAMSAQGQQVGDAEGKAHIRKLLEWTNNPPNFPEKQKVIDEAAAYVRAAPSQVTPEVPSQDELDAISWAGRLRHKHSSYDDKTNDAIDRHNEQIIKTVQEHAAYAERVSAQVFSPALNEEELAREILKLGKWVGAYHDRFEHDVAQIAARISAHTQSKIAAAQPQGHTPANPLQSVTGSAPAMSAVELADRIFSRQHPVWRVTFDGYVVLDKAELTALIQFYTAQLTGNSGELAGANDVNELRLKAFETNKPEDKQAYYKALSLWFQNTYQYQKMYTAPAHDGKGGV